MLKVWMVAAVLVTALPAAADPWKDESGHGRGRGEWKQEYWDGACKVERKFKGNGEYKEKIKCHGPAWVEPPPVVIVQGWPPLAYYAEADEGPCREYHTTATIDGRRQPLYGTACRQPDGSWAFVD